MAPHQLVGIGMGQGVGRDVTPLRLRVARAPTATLGDVCNGPLRRVRV